MKFKSTVLTLLVAGLVLSLSGIAYGDVVISLRASDNSVITLDDAAAAMGEIPLLQFSVTNNEASAISLTALSLDNSANVVNGDRFNIRVWKDANDNGVLDDADTALIAAGAAAAGASAANALDITDQTIAAGDSLNLIVTGAKLATAVGAGDLLELVVDDASALTITGAPTVADNPAVDPDDATKVPSIVIADAIGSVTTAVHSAAPISAANFANKKAAHLIASFSVTGDDAASSHILQAIRITDTGDAADADFDNARIFIDMDNNGVLSTTADAEMTLDTSAYVTGQNDYVLSTPVLIKNTATVNFLVTVDGQGTADEGEIVVAGIVAAGTLIDGNVATQDAVAGVTQTMKALLVAIESLDLAGPPFGRPNGLIDAYRLTFTAAGASADIDDDSVVIGDFTAQDAANAAYTLSAFSSTYASDSEDNNVIYLQISDEHSDANGASDVVPDLAYSGGTLIVSLDGLYGLPVFSETNATDAAPPVPLNAVTNDSNGDGYIDQFVIQFSEPLAASSILGFTFNGYTLDDATDVLDDPSNIAGLSTSVAPFSDMGEALVLTNTELDDFDTEATPTYTFSDVEGVIAGAGVGNNVALGVASFNNNNIPLIDAAPPTLVKATTLDSDSDGKFDNLQLDFSEPVILNTNIANLTAADITDNAGTATRGFDFGAAHTGSYEFKDTGNTGIGTATLMLPVNEVGSLDTAVKPSLIYRTTGGSILTDNASTPNLMVQSLGANEAVGGDTDEFVMVTTEAGVTSASKVWFLDSISPQITAAVTLDGSVFNSTANGKLDALRLTFSEAMGTDITTYEDLVVSGAVIDSASVSGSIVLARLVEDDYNTGLTPTITYSGTSIVDASGAKLGNINVSAVDNAKPLIVVAKTVDKGYGTIDMSTKNNGKIDAMEIMFSEPMNTAKLDQPASPATGHELFDEFSFATTYVVNDTVKIVDDQNMIIYITEGGAVDTDQLPDLRYSALGDSNLVDMHGYTLANITTPGGVGETDGAAPIATLAQTLDSNTDGYLDGVKITFSEDPVIDEEDTSKVLATVTMGLMSNEIDLSAATLSESGNAITFKGVSLGVGSEKWDTGILPRAFIAADNGIADAAGNVYCDADSIATTDNAKPVIGKALAQNNTKNITVTFSEPVGDENQNVLLASDFKYINVADSVNTTAIASVTGTYPTAVWALTTDNTLTDDHVTMDKLTIVDLKVEDITGIAAVVDTVSISDVEIPTLSSASTVDANNDGMIDNIKLVFTEEIKDANISGYTAALDSVIAIPSGNTLWTVSGYTVIGVNMTTSDDAAAIATAEAGKDVYNVSDVNNDAIIYLAIEQLTEADTDATPTLSMVGDSSYGSGVSDFSPNYVATITNAEISDKVGPVIMSAAMPTQTTLDVTFSEEVTDDLPSAKNTFVWEVGTERTTYVANSWVINMIKNEDRPNVLTLEVGAGNSVPGLTNSEIWYKAGSALKDLEGNANAAMTDSTDVTPPPEEGVNVAGSDLPDAFALSKNFPNPFNPTTTIEYAIPADGAGHVEMVIYNINGQKVRSLVNETKEAGYYSVVWDGRNDSGELVSSGLYLYKIVSGSFNKIEKMTFMK